MYKLFDVSVRGASHIAKGTPCEDFGLSLDTGKYKIFVTADGHGQASSFRSHIGSEMVCKIAAAALESFADSIYEDNSYEELLNNEKLQEQQIRQLIQHICSSWISGIEKHFNENPITPDESHFAGDFLKRYTQGECREHIYGTTLMAGILTEDFLLMLHQGDGRIVLFDEDANVSQPVPWDERCFGNVTTSMCDYDAAASCRYYIVGVKDKQITAVFAGSDGIDDSYPSSGEMYIFYRQLIQIAGESGIDVLMDNLLSFLPTLSEKCSRDDVTISGIINIERAKSDNASRKLERDAEIVSLTSTKAQSEKKIASMARKLVWLKDRWESVSREFDVLQEEGKRHAQCIKNIEKAIGDREIELAGIQEECESLREKLEPTQVALEGIHQLREEDAKDSSNAREECVQNPVGDVPNVDAVAVPAESCTERMGYEDAKEIPNYEKWHIRRQVRILERKIEKIKADKKALEEKYDNSNRRLMELEAECKQKEEDKNKAYEEYLQYKSTDEFHRQEILRVDARLKELGEI